MPKYNYIIIDEKGSKNSGLLYAPNKSVAAEKLNKKNSILISLNEEKKSKVYFWQKPSLNFEEKMLFVKNLSTMIKVGITVTEALKIIIDQTRKNSQREMFENITEMINSGQTLSKSLKNYSYIFSDLFINMIATGEKSGNLEQVLERLDIQLDKENEIRKKVFSAFIYPGIILSMTLLITLGIMIFIMPKITKIFKSFDAQLPLLTRTIIGFSDFLINKPLLATSGFMAIILFFRTIFTLKSLKPFWHRVVLYIPVFGKLLVYANLARFSRTLNSLLQSGIPITEALAVTSKMLDNSLYQKAITDALEKVKQGAKLGESLEGNEKLFTQLSTKMLLIGEKTGSLEVTTDRLADLYEHNVDNITKNLSVMLEPILLVFMAGLVGSIVLSIILPIYQLPNLIQR